MNDRVRRPIMLSSPGVYFHELDLSQYIGSVGTEQWGCYVGFVNQINTGAAGIAVDCVEFLVDDDYKRNFQTVLESVRTVEGRSNGRRLNRRRKKQIMRILRLPALIIPRPEFLQLSEPPF